MKVLKTMRKKIGKNQKKRDTSKILTGLLIGSLFGAAVSLLMAPASGEEIRRKIGGGAVGVQERIKTAAGNIESKARDLVGGTQSSVRRAPTAYPEG